MSHLKALLKAYVEDPKAIQCNMSGKAEDKPEMARGLVRLISENPMGFQRYSAAAFGKSA